MHLPGLLLQMSLSPVAGHFWATPLQETLKHSVCLSLLWGHCSVPLGPGTHKILFVPSRSLYFLQLWGSSIIKSCCHISRKCHITCVELDHEDWALKNWCFWGLLRVPWTGSRLNQSILKEINPEYHWQNWCWSWSANTLLLDVKNWLMKISWSWERLKAEREVGGRRWDD